MDIAKKGNTSAQELTDTSIVFIYVYRVTDRKTISFNTKPVNGKETIGKYVQLAVAYSKEDINFHWVKKAETHDTKSRLF